jgi:mycothiol synthase
MSVSAGIRLVDVDTTLVDAFLGYVRANGAEHDDSYIAPEDLASFDLATEPASAVLDRDGAVIGAASVMLNGYTAEGMSRFRILHTREPAAYAGLIDRTMARLPDAVERVFLFLPEHAGAVEEALEAAGFEITRRAYILGHADPGGAAATMFPSEVTVEGASPGVAKDWANVVNAAFRGQPGRYDMTPDRAAEILGRVRVLSEASLLATRGGVPAGVVLTCTDHSDPCLAEIETLAVIPSEQGKGLGRALLLTAVAGAARQGCRRVSLSVSPYSRHALSLYLDVGFRADDIRVCWQVHRSIPSDA